MLLNASYLPFTPKQASQDAFQQRFVKLSVNPDLQLP